MNKWTLWLSSLAIVLCLVCVLLLPPDVYAAEVASGTCGENLTWTLDNNGTLTISGTGMMYDYTEGGVPTYTGGAPWIDYRSEITSVVVEDGVTGIGEYAFCNCKNLTKVSLPNSLTQIGDLAFASCVSLAEISIPDSVVTIGDSAFVSCMKLAQVVIPDSVTDMGDRVFYNCENLTYASIGNGVTQIGEHAFDNCKQLTTVNIGNSVTVIGEHAFSECRKLKNVDLPDSLITIEIDAFRMCMSFTEIVIPHGVTTIENGAFYNCIDVTDLTIPSTVTFIGRGAFAECNRLENIYISDLLAWMTITYEDISSGQGLLNVTSYEKNLYLNGELLTDVVIPAEITHIPYGVFNTCSIESVTIHNGVTSIGDGAFMFCGKLKEVIIPESVTEIGTAAFRACESLTNVIIGSHVTTIGGSVFFDCSSLTQITIPDSVTELGVNAFEGCTSLKDAYIGSGITKILTRTFRYCSSLTRVDIPDQVEIIEEMAFEGCTNLKEVTFGENLVTIGEYAFQFCSSLRELQFPDSLMNLGSYAFYKCEALRTVVFGQGLEVISYRTFEGCRKLSKVEFPDTLKSIEACAFNNTDIRLVILPASLEFVGSDALPPVWTSYHLLYKGTEEQWDKIQFGHPDNYPKKDSVHFNCTGDEFVLTLYEPESCTEDGRWRITCSICEKDREQILNATGHQWEAATCTAPKTCTQCGITEGEPLSDGSGHRYGPWHWGQEATCTEAGWRVMECCYCGKQETQDTTASGHSIGEWTLTVEATCTETGEEMRACRYCDLQETKVLDAKGHADEDHNYFCDACTCNLCTEHNVDVIPGIGATCSKTGLTAEERCANCGEILVSQSVIPALGHSYGEWFQVTAPTTEETGMEERICSTCGDRERRELAKLEPADDSQNGNSRVLFIVSTLIGCIVAAGVAVVVILKKKRST